MKSSRRRFIHRLSMLSGGLAVPSIALSSLRHSKKSQLKSADHQIAGDTLLWAGPCDQEYMWLCMISGYSECWMTEMEEQSFKDKRPLHMPPFTQFSSSQLAQVTNRDYLGEPDAAFWLLLLLDQKYNLKKRCKTIDLQFYEYVVRDEGLPERRYLWVEAHKDCIGDLRRTLLELDTGVLLFESQQCWGGFVTLFGVPPAGSDIKLMTIN